MTTPCIEHNQNRKAGYGTTHRVINGRRVGMNLHRAVFYDLHGYLPEVVMHTCDNPRCINPEHLVGGTQMDNMRDKVAKGRHAACVWLRKLSPEQVSEIRGSSMSHSKLAVVYGVSSSTISRVKSLNTYGDL